MFVLLSKFLPLLVYPLGLSLLLLLIALLFGAKKKNLKWLITLALLILWTASTSPVANALARSLEWQYNYPADVPTTDAIVVLGGGTEPSIPPRRAVEINSAGDRVIAAARLYREGKAPVLILSGGNIDWLSTDTSTPASQMAELLSFLDIPSSAMILESTSQNTYENVLNTKKIMDNNGYDTVLLVTSAMHMPRSVSLFEKQGITVIPVPVDYSVVEEMNPPSTLDTILGLLPNAGNLSTTTNALKEYLGIWMYTLQGWI